MAFDDVGLYAGVCKDPIIPPGKFDCKNGEFIEDDLVCDFRQDCKNGEDEKYCGTCDFEENGLCGWDNNNNYGTYKWERKTNVSLDRSIGPDFDHTYNNSTGHYMSLQIRSNDSITNQSVTIIKGGQLVSPFYPRAHSTCHMKFWYIYLFI